MSVSELGFAAVDAFLGPDVAIARPALAGLPTGAFRPSVGLFDGVPLAGLFFAGRAGGATAPPFEVLPPEDEDFAAERLPATAVGLVFARADLSEIVLDRTVLAPEVFPTAAAARPLLAAGALAREAVRGSALELPDRCFRDRGDFGTEGPVVSAETAAVSTSTGLASTGSLSTDRLSSPAGAPARRFVEEVARTPFGFVGDVSPVSALAGRAALTMFFLPSCRHA